MDGGGACLSGIVGTKLCEGQAHCRWGCLAALLEEGALDRGGERFWVKRLAQDKPRWAPEWVYPATWAVTSLLEEGVCCY